MTAFVAVPVAALGRAVGNVSDTWSSMPSELKILSSPQRSEVYASDNKTLLAYFYDENRHDVKLSEVSKIMQHAIVASEDAKFYTHPGYDIGGIIRAFVSNSKGSQKSGASTITMQYVRQALTYYATSPADVVKATEDTPQRKLREIKYAIALEKKYTKNQILELYLNIAYFGHGAYGISAASQVYFNTTPGKLSPEQASLLAGLVKSPTQFDPADKTKRKQALDRREYVLAQMVKRHYLTQAQADKAQKTPLKFYGETTSNGCTATLSVSKLGAGFFCDYLRRWWEGNSAFGKNKYERMQKLKEGGYRIVSTLDVKTQTAANKYARHQPSVVPESQRVTLNSRNANMLVAVEPGTGKVLAMGVNRDFSNKTSRSTTTVPLLSGSSEVSGFQFGSTFKMFTVIAALEQGYSPNYVINAPGQFVSKYVVSSGDCVPYYCVTNSNPSFQDGPSTMYRGFGRSVNTWAVPLEQRVGSDKVVDVALRLGISFSAHGRPGAPSDYEFAHDRQLASQWGPMTLGVASTTSMEMASAYATLAAKGKYCVPVPVSKIIDRNGKSTGIKSNCKQVISESVADKAQDIARCPLGDTPKYGSCDGGTYEDAKGIIKKSIFGKSGTTDNSSSCVMIIGTDHIVTAGVQADPRRPLRPQVTPNHPSINAAVAYTVRDSGK